MRFIGKARRYQAAGDDLQTAITKAAQDCINEGILAEYLKTHASEVLNMLTIEWNAETAREVAIEEGREEGLDVSAQIITELKANKPINEIARKYNVSVKIVKKLQTALLAASA